MNCHICGHPITRHHIGGCWGSDKYHVCKAECNQTPETIAAHAVEAAEAEAREVVKPFAVYAGTWQTAAFGAPVGIYGKNNIHVKDLRRAAAWLASHPAPEDVRTARIRDIEYALSNEPVTKEQANALLEELAELGGDLQKNPPEFGSAEWFREIKEVKY